MAPAAAVSLKEPQAQRQVGPINKVVDTNIIKISHNIKEDKNKTSLFRVKTHWVIVLIVNSNNNKQVQFISSISIFDLNDVQLVLL
jgi:hypothetical protein